MRILGRFLFFVLQACNSEREKKNGLRESKAGQRARERAASGVVERWSVAEATDARQHPGLAGVSVTADGGIS